MSNYKIDEINENTKTAKWNVYLERLKGNDFKIHITETGDVFDDPPCSDGYALLWPVNPQNSGMAVIKNLLQTTPNFKNSNFYY